MSIVILTPNEFGHIQVFKGTHPEHYMRIRVSDRCITSSNGIDRKGAEGNNDVFINFTHEEWDLFKKSIEIADTL